MEGHSAAAVIDGSNYSGTAAPFILLMGDRQKAPGGTNRRAIASLHIPLPQTLGLLVQPRLFF